MRRFRRLVQPYRFPTVCTVWDISRVENYTLSHPPRTEQTLPPEEHPILTKLLEFERTFEQTYSRKMNDEERRVFRAAVKVIRQRLKAGDCGNAAD